MDDAHLAEEGKRLTHTDMAMTVHEEAHGLVADEIYPVVQGWPRTALVAGPVAVRHGSILPP